jgi:hypothetical protein
MRTCPRINLHTGEIRMCRASVTHGFTTACAVCAYPSAPRTPTKHRLDPGASNRFRTRFCYVCEGLRSTCARMQLRAALQGRSRSVRKPKSAVSNNNHRRSANARNWVLSKLFRVDSSEDKLKHTDRCRLVLPPRNQSPAAPLNLSVTSMRMRV